MEVYVETKRGDLEEGLEEEEDIFGLEEEEDIFGLEEEEDIFGLEMALRNLVLMFSLSSKFGK